MDFYGNTGLTAGSGFTPTLLGSVNSAGITTLGNLTAGSGANTVYRCLTAGAVLPAGALTITAASCGTSTDTGLRVK
jgi:hypothetical protein